MVPFDRPVGAQADAKELEYISALHQTGLTLREDGSIKDEDIKAYLRSRFGIEVTLEEVRWNILQGFGGSDGDGEVIDLMELTAIVLIPLLLKAAMLQQGQGLPRDVIPPPDLLLETVLQIILHDVTGRRDGYQELSPTFLKKMLTVYGETSMAQDDGLIHEMIQAANGTFGTEGVFDVQSFAAALTRDVRLYDVENETCPTTSMQDVFSYGQVSSKATGTYHTSVGLAPGNDHLAPTDSVREIDTLDHRFTAPAIDFQAGTYRSKVLAVSLWGCVMFGLFASAMGISEGQENECQDIGREGTRDENFSAFWCQMTDSIFGWLFIFLYFCAVGIISIGMGSLGNHVGPTRWYVPLIGAFYILVFGFTTIGLTTSKENRAENDVSYFRYMTGMSRFLACLTAFFHLRNFASIAFPQTNFERSVWARRLGLAPMEREFHVKTAGAHKVNQLVRNAMKLMKNQSNSSVFKTYFGHGLSAFALNGVTRKNTGGFFWHWASCLDRSIFEKEGVWYSTRLVASNFTQLAISIFILLLGIRLISEAKESFGAEQFEEQANWLMRDVISYGMNITDTKNATTELTNVFGSSLAMMMGESSVAVQCQDMASSNGSPLIEIFCSQDTVGYYDCSGVQNTEQALCILIENPYLSDEDATTAYQLMEASGFNSVSMQKAVNAQLYNFVHEAILSMYPTEEYMITVPLGIGMTVAVLAALRLTVLYLPGVTTTILELRSGVIPSLKSPHFEKYRVAPDTVALLTGSLFWGCLVSSLLMGSLVGFLVFLFLWQGSVYVMLRMCVILAGILSIITIKVVAVQFCCRQRFYQGLYRTRPAASNVLLLALEWANFVFTSAFILIRMVKIIFIAVASSGRIDRPLLAEGVGQLGPLEFDPYPTIHIRDLVAHEAHRHPYIEIIGTIYLMKLRYSKCFGSRAGSAWRLMFIYALLPWMHQYRISERQTTIDSSDCGEEDNDEVSVIPQRLPSLRGSSLQINASLLEAENKMLKEQINQLLSQQRHDD